MLLCHVMLCADAFRIRIEPNSAIASRDFRMNGVAARRDPGGTRPAPALRERSSMIARTALADHAARSTGSRGPAITDHEPEHRTACRHAHAVWHAARESS